MKLIYCLWALLLPVLHLNAQSPPGPPARTGKVVGSDTKEALVGTTLILKSKNIHFTSDEAGNFRIPEVSLTDTLLVSHVGFQSQQIILRPGDKKPLMIALATSGKILDEVIVSTGYQQLPKERVTGSFDVIDNDLYNRRVSTDVLTKIDGIASGVYFNGSGGALNATYGLPNVAQNPADRLGINIRGQSTLSNNVSKDPLIVVDNFPYEGDINNLDPEMVQSVTVLKDAAAASIWGARAGNGVIVITTKNAHLNQKMKIDVNVNYTIGGKPNVFYDKSFLNSSSYINVEDTLFAKGYLDNDLTNTYSFPAISPVANILNEESLGQITPANATSQINALRHLDVRNDYEKYIYQKSLNQQYGITLSGGGNNLTYAVTVAYDDNKTNLIRNGVERFVINSNNTYIPIKNLELTAGMIYSQVSMQSDNSYAWGQGGLSVGGDSYNRLYPYAQLADAKGNPLPIAQDYSFSYIDSVEQLGFLGWSYRPLQELALADNTTKQNDITLRTSAKYHFSAFLNAEVQYQSEIQNSTNRIYYSDSTFYARNLINEFAQYDPSSSILTYPIPVGGILSLAPSTSVANNLRTQINYNQDFRKRHVINAIAGAEIRQITTSSYTRTSYGYDPLHGTSINGLDFSDYFNGNAGGGGYIPPPDGSIAETLNRYISYYANAAYTYNDRYTFTVSGRKDGANIFGVKINDRITPLWSAGGGWNISKEKFYRWRWLPYLKFRATYGFNGNVYNGSAFITGSYGTSLLTNAQEFTVNTAPNSQLRWEKVKNINWGIDFVTKNRILSGSVELYIKDGQDLIEPVPLAASTGFSTFTGNAAGTATQGMDFTLTSKNIVSGHFSWYTTLLLSLIHDKITKYDVPQTAGSIGNGVIGIVGKPIYAVYSYKWAGLNPQTGDPIGYLNGKASNNYTSIINNYNPDSLKYHGDGIPSVFGSLRNNFSYKQFSLSFNIVYKLGYYFRRPSTSLNYADIIGSGAHSDYDLRWQKPGDEKHTYVPSTIYPSDPNRNTFYQYSSVLVDRGDFIRFQDLSLGYDFSKRQIRMKPFNQLQLYAYINNIGILWRANKQGIDPDYVGTGALPNPMTIAFGIKANL